MNRDGYERFLPARECLLRPIRPVVLCETCGGKGWLALRLGWMLTSIHGWSVFSPMRVECPFGCKGDDQ